MNSATPSLEKYFTPDTEVHVTLSVEKERQKIEVTIPVKRNIIRAEEVSNDMYVSIDLVEEVIERQLKKYKNTYKNISIKLISNGFKISAQRQPTKENYWLNMYQIVQPTDSGMKIVEEMMQTKVQAFLNKK